jgi:nucleotide-binding universal stress UspA family protein
VPYGSILVAFDGSEFSKKALSRACRIAGLEGSKLTVLYVVPRYEEMVEFFMTGAIKSSLMKEAEKITKAACKLAMEMRVSAKALIEDGDAGLKIAETAVKGKNDLRIVELPVVLPQGMHLCF